MTLGDDEALHQQCFVAILTCLGFLEGAHGHRIIVVTDQPARYRYFGRHVDLWVPQAEQIATWRGEQGLFSRIKIEALRELLQTHGPAHLLALDSDILARRPLRPLLERLAGGTLYMHKREYLWSRGGSRRRRRVWRRIGERSFAGHRVTTRTQMWNAGVLGIPWETRRVLDEALAVYDALAEAGLHRLRHTIQQHSLSLVMQDAGAIQPAEDWFIHYWPNKPGHMPKIRRMLATLLARGLDVDQAARYAVEHPIRQSLSVWNRRAYELVERWLPCS